MTSSKPTRQAWIATAIFLLNLAVCFNTSAQSILNVGAGQTYTSVQAAVNAASTVQVDTVNIVTSPITEVAILVNKNIVIRGQGMNSTIVQGAASPGVASNRIMIVQAGFTVHLMKLTIQNGVSPNGVDMGGPGGIGGDALNGGGIYNSGTLTMTQCKLANNYGGNGGGGVSGSIPPVGSPVLSTMGGNGGHGGGVWNEGTLILRQCALVGNKSGAGGIGGIPAVAYLGGAMAGSLDGGPGAAGGSGGNGGYGAAIYNTGTIKMIETTVSGNICGSGAAGSNGANGGDGLASLKAAIQSGAGGNGGAGGHGGVGGYGTIYNAGTIDTIFNCTVYGNAAGNGGNGGVGGYGGAGTKGADSIQSPVQGPAFYGGTGGNGGSGGLGGNGGNAGHGGGIYNTAGHVINFIINTTISQNVAGTLAGNGGNGGSCGMFGFAGSATPTPPGISGQPGQVGTNGSGGNGANGGTGGGIFNFTDLVFCKNNIIAGNSFTAALGAAGNPGSQIMGNSGVAGAIGFAGSSPDVQGTFSGLGYNVIGKNNGSNFLNGVFNNICGTIASPLNAQVGPLADNGGYTETAIIAATSVARDAGNAALAPLKDQRGSTRNGTLDIGSYEYQLPSFAISDDGLINEGAENGELITLTVTEDVFNSTLNAANFTVNYLPGGVTKGAITRVDGHHVTIALSGNRTTDYDVDITDVEVVVSHLELAGLTTGTLDESVGVTMHAYVESCTATTVGTLLESSLNGDTVQILLIQDNFLDATLLPANFTLTKAPAGVSVASAFYVDPTHANLILGFTGTDFDVDSINVQIVINQNEIYGAANLTTNKFTIKAFIESGLAESALEQNLKIYPNPARHTLNITSDLQDGSIVITVFDVTGKQLLSSVVGMVQHQGTIDISTLSPGLYLLQLKSPEGIATIRFNVY